MKTFFITTVLALCALAGIAHTAEVSDIKLDALAKTPEPKWGRDPFLRYDDKFKGQPVVREDDFPDLRINGIISNGKRAVAIINGMFLRKGDSIEGFKVMDISSDKVLLEKNGRKFYLGIDRFARRLGGQ